MSAKQRLANAEVTGDALRSVSGLDTAGSGVGKALIEELLGSTHPQFQITVLARPTSSYIAPSERIKLVKADLTDPVAIVEALRGIDAVVRTHGADKDFFLTSKAVIDAAIEAGVKMVMPSDFGGKDTPIFMQATAHKVPVRAYLKEKVEEGKITSTVIKNGAFWSIPLRALGINYAAKKVTLFDDGNRKFHTSTLSSIARAVVGVLRSPSEFVNKDVYIHDFHTSQREILSIVEAETGGVKFEEATIDVDEVGKKSLEALKRGERNPQNVFGALRFAVGEEGAADWNENDNSEALGLEKKDLHLEIKRKIEQGL